MTPEETGILNPQARGDGGETKPGGDRAELDRARLSSGPNRPPGSLCHCESPGHKSRCKAYPCSLRTFMPAPGAGLPAPRPSREQKARRGGKPGTKMQETRTSDTANTPKPAWRANTLGRASRVWPRGAEC